MTASLCEHLQPLLDDLLARGATITYAGQAWSRHCRTWVYLDAVFDLAAIRSRVDLPPCVIDHVHRGTHGGAEQGFVCTRCNDAEMGLHSEVTGGHRRVID